MDERKAPEGRFRSRLSSRGQVVIPQALREWAELREGVAVEFHPLEDGSILVRRGAPDGSPFRRFRGAWKDDAVAVRERLRSMRRPELEPLQPERRG